MSLPSREFYLSMGTVVVEKSVIWKRLGLVQVGLIMTEMEISIFTL